MDNSPRNPYLDQRRHGRRHLLRRWCCSPANWPRSPRCSARRTKATASEREADELARLINQQMWDPERKFYFDLTVDGKRAPVKTIAGVLDAAGRRGLAATGRCPGGRTATTRHIRPAAPRADHRRRRGAATTRRAATGAGRSGRRPTRWSIRGLERTASTTWPAKSPWSTCGSWARCSSKTGTVWENYAPDAAEPGKPGQGRLRRLDGHRPDPLPPRIRHRPEARRAGEHADLGPPATKGWGASGTASTGTSRTWTPRRVPTANAGW